MQIGTYAYDEYLHLVRSFHGNLAPGLVVGGFMVDCALKQAPPGKLYDVLCETPVCLPDAVQLLTPCTIGNGWLKILPYGRFALALYDKETGEGVRVWLDVAKLDPWPEIRNWFLKFTPKKMQDKDKLFAEIRTAGTAILSHRPVRVRVEDWQKKRLGPIAVCPACGEAYPARDGERCLACQEPSPYL